MKDMSYKDKSKRWYYRLFSDDDNEIAFVAEYEEKIVGFISGSSAQTDSVYKREVSCLYLLEAYQSKGIGKQLLYNLMEEYIKQDINSLIIWTLENSKAKYFYEHLGGKVIRKGTVIRGGKKVKRIAFGWEGLVE